MSTHIATDTSPGRDEHRAGADAIRSLRARPRNAHLAGGFGPLVVGVVLFLLMLWAAPSVAPEHVVERPATATTTATTTSTTAVPPAGQP